MTLSSVNSQLQRTFGSIAGSKTEVAADPHSTVVTVTPVEHLPSRGSRSEPNFCCVNLSPFRGVVQRAARGLQRAGVRRVQWLDQACEPGNTGALAS